MKLMILLAIVVLTLQPHFVYTQSQDERASLYAKYSENKKGGAEGQKLAYESAKEYLRRFGSDKDPKVDELRKFVTSYERLLELDSLLTARQYAKVFELGGQILTLEPDNFYVLTKVVQAGFTASQAGDPNMTAESIRFAKRALELLESGKVKDPSPLANIEAARSFHSIALATLSLEGAPEDATALFLKLIHSDELKNEPTMYYYYGRGLLKGEYQKLVTEFKQKYEGKPDSAESRALLARINQVVERIVDAYARAVALSTKPEQQTTRTEILSQLTPMYKALHNNSDVGLNELIETVLSKPMP